MTHRRHFTEKDRQRVCGHKIPYRSNVGAAWAIERMKARGIVEKPGWRLRGYHCPFCRHWHIGHVAAPQKPGGES